MAEYREDPPPQRREVVERHEVVERQGAAPPPPPRSGGLDWIWIVLLVLVALVLGWFVITRGQPLQWGERGGVNLEVPRIETPSVERRIEIEVPQPAAPRAEPAQPPAPEAPPPQEPPSSP